MPSSLQRNTIISMSKDLFQQMENHDYNPDNDVQRNIIEKFAMMTQTKQCYYELQYTVSSSQLEINPIGGSNAPRLCQNVIFSIKEIGQLLLQGTYCSYNYDPTLKGRYLENLIMQLAFTNGCIKSEGRRLSSFSLSLAIRECFSLQNQSTHLVREIMGRTKFVKFKRDNLSEKCNSSFAFKFYTALCKPPNNGQLTEIMQRFPPLTVHSIAQLPSTYPPAALGMCYITSYTIEGKFDVSLHHKNFRWAPKREKTKLKRSNAIKPARIISAERKEKKRNSKSKDKKLLLIMNEFVSYRALLPIS